MEKTIYDIVPHTIFLTIGPSSCGKTHFCKNVLIPKIEKLSAIENRDKVSINYISSDDIRRTLLGQENFSKYHQGMLAASKGAFDVLYCQLEAATSFPINSEYIIIDTKGTNSNFREKILEIAYKNNYNVTVLLFNYKNFDDYKKYSEMNKFTQKDIKKVRELSGGTLKKLGRIRQVISIKSIDFDNLNFDLSFEKHELYKKCFVSNDREILVIGDVHGCYDEFIELLELNNIEVLNHQIVSNTHDKLIVINGDYIDKGPKIFDMIEFCYYNLKDIVVTIGNHENRLYKELTEGLEHISEEWFTTYDIIDEEHKEMFKKVFENSLPFVMNDKFIATHAPCNVKYLGKIDGKSQSRERYYKQENLESLYDELNKIELFDKDLCNVTHIFGHIQTSTPGCSIYRRILSDGGCVIGGKLVGIEVGYTGKTYVKYVESHQPKEEELQHLRRYLLKREVVEKSLYDELLPKEKARIDYMLQDGVNFVSGTMSPCDKMNEKLESIESAITFFKNMDVTDVVIEPKYMGSRMNMYLFETNEESYAISRSGYPVEIDGLDVLYDKMRNVLNVDWTKIKLIILDGECMPWSAMGDGLVKDFKVVDDCVKAEDKFLAKTQFEKNFKELIKKLEDTDFNKDKNLMPKKDMIKKYGNFQYENLKVASEYKEYIDVDTKEEMRKVYNEQLHLYGDTSDLDYKPFAVLKIVYTDGSERILYDDPGDWTNETMFNRLNPDGCHRYDLNKPEDVENCIKQFEMYTTVEKYEGIVMKPNSLTERDIPPYMKVRNPNYLTIVYGYDYLDKNKYEKLYERKSIRGKLRLSKIEWEQGLKMLRVKYDSLKESNKMKQLLATFITSDKESEKFDPRL